MRTLVPAFQGTSSLAELLAWERAHGRLPLIVKPCASACTSGVFLCQSEDEVRSTFDAVLGTWGDLFSACV